MIKVLYNSERRRKAFITKELKQKKIAGDNWKRRVSLTPSGTRDLTPRA